jgi:streptogramin lyase
VYDVPTAKAGPAFLVFGPDGNMWFTESTADKIGRITPTGAITEFKLPTKGGFPDGIRAGSNGVLWFAEAVAGKIGSISLQGTIKEYPVGRELSDELALDSTGNLWFGDPGKNAIGRMTSRSKVTILSFRSPKHIPRQLVAAPDDTIWFSDGSFGTGALGRINKGKITEYSFSHASGVAPYMGIDSVAVATDGAVWFAELNANLIARRSTSGTLAEYALPSPKSRVVELVAGKHDDVWFTMGDNDIFGHVTAQGKMTEYTIPDAGGGPSGLALDPDGNVWIAEYFADKIVKVSMPR